MSDANEPVKSIVTPSRVAYHYTPGRATSRFLRNLAKGKIVGQECPKCRMVYVPPRGACPRCGVATERDVPVADTGTLVTYSVIRVPSANIQIELPYVGGQVLLDGSHIAFHCLIRNVDVATVRMGMRVRAVWKPESEWTTSFENIEYFEPTGEPDVPYEKYKDLF
ncbi:MAG: Zn-ribbon domain-containing OB-fold protein [Myxococcales bacterium]|nr:Zn-ribbon domain-containing OB-fold protein [Myxococcales bacterium]